MPSFSLSILQQMVLDRLDNNSSLYTAPELTYVINEAVRVVSLFTGFFRSTLHLPGFTVANKIVYNTPTGMLVPIFICYEGRQLQKITLRKLARTRRNWATATTAALGLVDYWALIGIGQFILNPIDSTGGHDLTITGLGEPPLLVNPTDTLVIENEYVELITAYGAHRLPLKEGGKIFADGSVELNEFYEKLKERSRYESFKAPDYKLIRQFAGATTMIQKAVQ
jgi:hypothetical protein